MKIRLTDKNKEGIFMEFAKLLGATMNGRFLQIPSNKGGGYITGYKVNDDLRILIRNFYLKTETLLERTIVGEDNDFIIFSFNDVFDSFLEKSSTAAKPYKMPSVAIFSSKAYSAIKFSPNTFFRNVNIGVSQNYLQELFGKIEHPIVKRILQKDEDFFFESEITPSIIKVANDLATEKIDVSLEELFYKIKSNEMLYYLFNNLIKRDVEQVRRIHIEDIKSIYKIKSLLQENIGEIPKVSDLAKNANMSEPKLRKLFRQTVGKSVFDYYQTLRIQEAARLLKDEKLSVSEVGYQLGFTNLSHFSRVFEKYIGMKPKKYSYTKID